MSSSSDTHQIANLLSGDESHVMKDSDFFSDEQWNFIQDTNGPANYAQTNICTLTTQQIQNIWWNPADSYLGILLNAQSATGTRPYASGANSISFRQQTTDIISSVQMRLGGGSILQNDTPLTSNIRSRLGFLVDRSLDFFNNQLNTAISDKDTADVSAVGTNTGFASRVNRFLNQSNTTSGVIQIPIIIPLRWISGFCAALDQPVTGLNIMFQFGLNLGSTFQFAPMLVDNATTDLPRVSIAAPIQLYYKQISLPLQVQERVNQKVASGTMTRKFNFLTSQVIPITGYQNSTATSIVANLGNAFINPRRIFFAGVIANSASNPAVPFIYAGLLTNLQVKVNNATNVYVNPPQTNYDMFRNLESQFPGFGQSEYCGSVITYADFILPTGTRPNCCDLSYLVSRLASPTTACSIDVTANVAIPPGVSALDWYAIVDSETTAKINMGQTTTDIIVGPNL
jgi:hypothetical protein